MFMALFLKKFYIETVKRKTRLNFFIPKDFMAGSLLYPESTQIAATTEKYPNIKTASTRKNYCDTRLGTSFLGNSLAVP